MFNIRRKLTSVNSKITQPSQVVPTFNASTIPNVNLWFDASHGVVTSTGTAVTQGNKVFGWKNKLNDILRASCSAPAEQPTLTSTNGRSTIRFSGGQDLLNAGGGLTLSGSTEYSIISVITRKRASGPYFDYIFSTNNGNNPTLNCVINNLSSNFQPGINRPNGTTISYKNGSTSNLTIATDETCVVAVTTSGGIPSNSGSPYQIGFGYVGGTNYFLTGDISEIVIVGRAMSASEILITSNQLKAKYGIT